MNNSDEAISQEEYSLFKNTWVRRECYLHTLFLNGELPVLDSDDLIFIPDEFNPSQEGLNRYRTVIRKLWKRLVKRTITEEKVYDSSIEKGTFWKKFSKVVDQFYQRLIDPTELQKLHSNQEWNLKLMKLDLLLFDTTFCLDRTINVIVDFGDNEAKSNRDSLKIPKAVSTNATNVRLVKKKKFRKSF